MTRNYHLSLEMLVDRRVYIRSQSLIVFFIYTFPFYLLQKRSRRCQSITQNMQIRLIELSILVEGSVMTVLRRYHLDWNLYQCCRFPLMALEFSVIQIDVSKYGTQPVGRRLLNRWLQKTIKAMHCLPLTYLTEDMSL